MKIIILNVEGVHGYKPNVSVYFYTIAHYITKESIDTILTLSDNVSDMDMKASITYGTAHTLWENYMYESVSEYLN